MQGSNWLNVVWTRCVRDRRTFSRRVLTVLMATTVSVVAAVAGSPAAPAWADPPIDPYPTWTQAGCLGVAVEQPGVVEFRAMLYARYGIGGGIFACSGYEHGEGRALDWMVNRFDPAQNVMANEVIGWLMATDAAGNPHAMARRLGLGQIIWDDHFYNFYGSYYDTDYSECTPAMYGQGQYAGTCHTNHIHFAFSWAGALGQTSWFTMSPRPTPGPVVADDDDAGDVLPYTDLNGDGRTDIALTGGPQWNTLPVASSMGDGSFSVVNQPAGGFETLPGLLGVKTHGADFNGDGRTDLALTGGPNWYTIPIAFSDGDGTFTFTNGPSNWFTSLIELPGVKVHVGDFDGNEMADLALTGGPNWNTVPVAFSNGDGTFNVTNAANPFFVGFITQAGAKVRTGDFNNDGRTDLSVTGGQNWTSVPIGFSNGDGTFTITNSPIGEFGLWNAVPGVKEHHADFNGDGRTDIALTGGPSWYSIPVAFSNGNGSFSVTNLSYNWFTSLIGLNGVKVHIGDFDGNDTADIALTGGPNWNTMPIAFSNGDGTFTVTNAANAFFNGFVAQPGVSAHTGDFNNDGRADFALTGGPNWTSVPMAFSQGDGTFAITNSWIGEFALWPALPGVTVH